MHMRCVQPIRQHPLLAYLSTLLACQCCAVLVAMTVGWAVEAVV
jgi:hypothetical protein